MPIASRGWALALDTDIFGPVGPSQLGLHLLPDLWPLALPPGRHMKLLDHMVLWARAAIANCSVPMPRPILRPTGRAITCSL